MPTVLITGANRGLGFEFARQYAADGWRVIGTARHPASADALAGTGAEIHALDVRDAEAVGRLARQLGDEPIDVLIANAGVAGPRDMTAEAVDVEGWVETFRTNTIAPLVVAGAFARHVAKSRQRKLVAISSRLGSLEANEEGGMYVYRSSKAALNAAFRSFAIDRREVIAVLLHPGWVRTDMGGEAAPLTAPESVAGMRRVIGGLTQQDSGRFFDYEGTPVPW
jgi:NAD(P)-dependent dehydrogenase (short-subunit alcohol dehydrogenase family)